MLSEDPFTEDTCPPPITSCQLASDAFQDSVESNVTSSEASPFESIPDPADYGASKPKGKQDKLIDEDTPFEPRA